MVENVTLKYKAMSSVRIFQCKLKLNISLSGQNAEVTENDFFLDTKSTY